MKVQQICSRPHLLLILRSYWIGWQQNTTVISQLFTVCRLPLQLLTGKNSSCHYHSRNYHPGRTESSVKILLLDRRTVFTGGHAPSLSDGWLGPDEEVIYKFTQFWPSDLYDNCLIDLFKIINIMQTIVIDEIDSFSWEIRIINFKFSYLRTVEKRPLTYLVECI